MLGSAERKFPEDNLKLSHRALILVLAPVIFEVLLVSTLAILLAQSRAETKREANARQVLAHCQLLINTVLRTASRFDREPNIDNLDQEVTAIRHEESLLFAMVADHPRSMNSLKEIERSIDVALDHWRKYKKLLGNGDRSQAMNKMAELRSLIGPISEHGRFNFLNDDYVEIANASPLVQQKVQHRMMLALWLGLVSSVILAFVLVHFFKITMMQRLQVLLDNAHRLQSGMPLNPYLGGADEIAHVDRTFHEMAKTITNAAHKLRSSESRLRSVIEQMPMGLITLNDQWGIESVNPRAELMFGRCSQELSGKRFIELLYATEILSGQLQEMLVGTQTKTRQLKGKRSTGAEFPIDLTVTEFHQLDRHGFLAHVQDVTERLAVERLKQEFVAMISHDLRTPLTSIKLSLKLLATETYGSVSEGGLARLEGSFRNCNKVITLIDDLLELEKLEAGRLEIEPEIVELTMIIEHAIDAVAMLAENNEIGIEVQDTARIKVLVDETRMIQVFTNLLSNAIKFSPAGSIVRIIALESEDWVDIKFADQGTGIPESHRDLIFDRFRQVRIEDRSRKGGFGLGLAICKVIVEDHDGTIGVESTEGVGSTFLVRLPSSRSPLSTGKLTGLKSSR